MEKATKCLLKRYYENLQFKRRLRWRLQSRHQNIHHSKGLKARSGFLSFRECLSCRYLHYQEFIKAQLQEHSYSCCQSKGTVIFCHYDVTTFLNQLNQNKLWCSW